MVAIVVKINCLIANVQDRYDSTSCLITTMYALHNITFFSLSDSTGHGFYFHVPYIDVWLNWYSNSLQNCDLKVQILSRLLEF